MQAGETTSERMLQEAEFRARQRRVLRAEAWVVGVFALGVALAFWANQTAPAWVGTAAMVLVLGTGAAMWLVRRTADRHWRCPGCDTRWETRDTLASLNWNHCAECGLALRTHPQQRDKERIALTEFTLEGLSHAQLVERWERRRRRSMIVGGAIAVAGIAALVWVEAREVGELAGHLVIAGFAGVVAAVFVHGARCPRCRTGVVGRGRHCQRCGLNLASPLSEELDRRTGA